MIKKQNFCKILRALAVQIDKDNEFIDALKPYFDGHPVFTHTHEMSENIISALEDEMQDIGYPDDIDSCISIWLFEDDCGRGENSWIELESGERIELKTPEQLYDFLRSSQDDK